MCVCVSIIVSKSKFVFGSFAKELLPVLSDESRFLGRGARAGLGFRGGGGLGLATGTGTGRRHTNTHIKKKPKQKINTQN